MSTVKIEISDNQKRMLKAIIGKESLKELSLEGKFLIADPKTFTEKTAQAVMRGLKGLYAARVKEVAAGKSPAKSINGRAGSANNLINRMSKNGLTVTGHIGSAKKAEEDFSY